MATILFGHMIILSFIALTNVNAGDDLLLPPKDDFLVYPVTAPTSRIRKRDTSQIKSDAEFHQLIEKKLTQHSQALEHLVQSAQTNEDMIRKLIDNFSSYIPEPKMPEKLQITSRRSFGGGPGQGSSTLTPVKISPWCAVAAVCRKTGSVVCGYDDNFGYGKFDDICHMLQVNCYWKYNFALVAHCRPLLS
ncbi:hypothetical protein NE865_03207 [Phthorimaea operculella]|nr:hypothetical protein NE865_03207 [Phthorimaea operculella]